MWIIGFACFGVATTWWTARGIWIASGALFLSTNCFTSSSARISPRPIRMIFFLSGVRNAATMVVSAGGPLGLTPKRRGARLPAPLGESEPQLELGDAVACRTGGVRDGRRTTDATGIRPRVRADGVLLAVAVLGRVRAGLERRRDAGHQGAELRAADAVVGVRRRVGARAVVVVALRGRHGGAHVRLGSRGLGLGAEAQVRRNGDRNQDADDDDDDEELDQGEALLARHAGLDLVDHVNSLLKGGEQSRSSLGSDIGRSRHTAQPRMGDRRVTRLTPSE